MKLMYEELVERLRSQCRGYGKECEDCNADGNCRSQMENEAADAIECLSCRETPMKITEIHVDEYYCPACGAENNCDQGHVQDAYCPVCEQRLLSEPQKEE